MLRFMPTFLAKHLTADSCLKDQNRIPYIELKVDHLPVRMLGAIGAGLVVLGFVAGAPN